MIPRTSVATTFPGCQDGIFGRHSGGVVDQGEGLLAAGGIALRQVERLAQIDRAAVEVNRGLAWGVISPMPQLRGFCRDRRV